MRCNGFTSAPRLHTVNCVVVDGAHRGGVRRRCGGAGVCLTWFALLVSLVSVIEFASKLWTCPFCMTRNHFPPHYAENISDTNLPAELIPQFTTLEYQLPGKVCGRAAPALQRTAGRCLSAAAVVLRAVCRHPLSQIAHVTSVSGCGPAGVLVRRGLVPRRRRAGLPQGLIAAGAEASDVTVLPFAVLQLPSDRRLISLLTHG